MSAVPETETARASGPAGPIGPVAEAFRGAMVESLGVPNKTPNVIRELLTEHFEGTDPESLPTLTDSYGTHLHLTFHLALEEFLAEDGRTHEIHGVHCPSGATERVVDESGANSLALLMADASYAWAPSLFSPIEYHMVPSSATETRACLKRGLILYRDALGPGVIWVRGILNNRIMLDVMHPSRERATEILAQLRERGVALSPYRGQVVEIGYDWMFAPNITFLERPAHTEADQVILPAGLLEQIEEHSIEIVRARDALKASGRHLKRGLLLHGRPGTGKTHTIRYLISQMPGVTVAVMSGTRMLGDGVLQPLMVIRDVIDVIGAAVIILDDVDFIAEDRTLPGMTPSRDSLFALLELLDGIDDDADLLFVLTTNRPNTLEPAVAARPGRIDQAVEIPLPDADCRRRLLELYTRDMAVEAEDADVASFVDRTDGVTASFIREAVRRTAALSILEEGVDVDAPVVVTGAGLLATLDELLDPSNPLAPILLGAEPEHAQAVLARVIAPADAAGSSGASDADAESDA